MYPPTSKQGGLLLLSLDRFEPNQLFWQNIGPPAKRRSVLTDKWSPDAALFFCRLH